MCIGSIIGDVTGSIYEGSNKNPSRVNFKLFPFNACYTDDTVLLVATMSAILNSIDDNIEYGKYYREYYRKYPFVGYGKAFKVWGKSDTIEGYGSYGNGSAMRAAPISWAFNTKEEVLKQAKLSAECTHNSEEGIRGSQAIAYAVFLARTGSSKKEIKIAMEKEMGYDLVNLKRGFDNTCIGSVPIAIVAFLNSKSFVDAIRGAILMGGDSDTIASMSGSIAEAYYGTGLTAIPTNIIKNVFKRLPDELAEVVVDFTKKYVDQNFVRPANMSNNAKLNDLFRAVFKR